MFETANANTRIVQVFVNKEEIGFLSEIEL